MFWWAVTSDRARLSRTLWSVQVSALCMPLFACALRVLQFPHGLMPSSCQSLSGHWLPSILPHELSRLPGRMSCSWRASQSAQYRSSDFLAPAPKVYPHNQVPNAKRLLAPQRTFLGEVQRRQSCWPICTARSCASYLQHYCEWRRLLAPRGYLWSSTAAVHPTLHRKEWSSWGRCPSEFRSHPRIFPCPPRGPPLLR